MLKKIIPILMLCAYGIAAEAARLHGFFGYSHPEGITETGKSRSLIASHWGGFSLVGAGANAQPGKYVIVEGSVFIPGVIRQKREKGTKNGTETGCLSLAGDLMAKIMLPIPKIPSHTKVYVKTGPWGLHATRNVYDISTTQDGKLKNEKPITKELTSGGGWALGGGTTVTGLIPFWPRIPLDIFAVYYMPITLPDSLSGYLPERFQRNGVQRGFWSFKIGLMTR